MSFGTLEKLNSKLRPIITDITQRTDYFGYYRLDLYGRDCPFWDDDDGTCGNRACAVTTIDDEKDVPEVWRAAELGKLEGPKAAHPSGAKGAEPSPLDGALGEGTEESCVVEDDECDSRDYCVPEDESAGNGNYVSLTENPERFTGYGGHSAHNVWNSIYRENCFSKTGPGLNALASQNLASQDFLNVLQNRGKHELYTDSMGHPALTNIEVDDECLEKRVFYRVVSGMHASISMHLCWDYLNQTTGEWGPNLDCFLERFSEHTERLQNIYFNYAVLLRAVSKLRGYLPSFTFCSGDAAQNRATKAKVLRLASALPAGSEIFDESLMFKDEMIGLKEDFRNRFRNVSRVMDCVGCDKCRLWGKVQTQGYGTALKVLFEFDESLGVDNPTLRRTELVALINTLDRVSHSLEALRGFQEMWETRKNMQREEIQQRYREELRRQLKDKTPEGPSKKEPEKEKEKTLVDDFWQEWELVWQAFFIVIDMWRQFPGHLYNFTTEGLSSIWDGFLGKPVQPPFLRKTEL